MKLIILITVFVMMTQLLSCVHRGVMKGANQDRGWIIIHHLRGLFFWPLYLVELIQDWKRLLIGLAAYSGFATFVAFQFSIAVWPLIGISATWWVVAAFLVGMEQELKKPYPFADPF